MRAPLLLLTAAAALLSSAACVTPRPTQGDSDDFASLAASREPWEASNRRPILPPSPIEHTDWRPLGSSSARAGMTSSFIEIGFWFYSTFLTQVDGPRCEHRPTCSRYARDAVRKHGFLVGSWLAVDRLMRSSNSSSLRQLPILKYHEGKPYFADPIHENDFFF